MSVEKVDLQSVQPETKQTFQGKKSVPSDIHESHDEEKRNAAKYAIGAVALAATVAAGIVFKGKFRKVLLNGTNGIGRHAPLGTHIRDEKVIMSISERTLSNGKKVVRTVADNPDGTKTVEMKLFNSDGSHAYTKTKNITKTVDENGTVISRIDKYSGNGKETVIRLGKDKDSYGYDWINKDELKFTNGGEREIVRTYDKNNKLIGRDTRLVSMENNPSDNMVRFERLTFEPETGKVSSKSQHWRGLSFNRGLVNTLSFDCTGNIPKGESVMDGLKGFPDEICKKMRIKAGNREYCVVKDPIWTYDPENMTSTITDGAKS